MNIQNIRTLAKENEIDTLMTGDMESIFAACCKACENTLNISPFDEQLEAAKELCEGRIVEMKTGEGKTLSAAIAAVYTAKTGTKVHILTFNDYLAKRDLLWMKPIFDATGITAGYITQDTEREKRKELYQRQITYITARECGFDFLRDFIADDENDIVQSPLQFAIADEADSIMIDEAKVPLVIAGENKIRQDTEMPGIYDFVKTLDDSMYELYPEGDTVYLTEKGERALEKHFLSEGSLYDEENNVLLTKITDCLKACFILKRDKDYIISAGKIKIIDEFTGRAAENRRYPGTLQTAVELKENIVSTSRGVVMGVIPMQFFLRCFPKISGMTGTAKAGEDEFYQLYDLKVSVIPTRTPCIRNDYPYEIYLTKEEKYKAVIDRVVSAHQKNQPVLIGTQDIEESELINKRLLEKGITPQLISAKNDELEAEIIKNAGMPGAVTVSANMSGRGVDIRLGGADEKRAEEVKSAGGLLIIGTFMSESERGDMQLRGRSGRQGDIGESRMYVALEDEIMDKYGLKKLIPQRHYPKAATGQPVEDKVVRREVERIQRIAQGDTLELRRRLLKFTMIGEKHRDIVFGRRGAFLKGESKPEIWNRHFPDMYDKAVAKFGERAVEEAQLKTVLRVINEYWSDYLDYTSYLRDGIHLTRIGGKNPADEYNITCEEYFSGMEQQVIDAMGERLEKLCQLKDISEYAVEKPISISTYTLNESGEELLKKSFIETALDDEEELSEYYEDDDEDEDDTPEEIKEEKTEKKGFFRKLFGK